MTRIEAWLPHPASPELTARIERIARAPGVVHVALMPDAHLAEDVCVGTVTATRRRIYPAAVGGDIGCGMIALAFHADADVLQDEHVAARLFDGMYQRIPAGRHVSEHAPPLPDELLERPLSKPALEKMKGREARLELGTLGRGNHFLELQRADDGRLWVLLHSGSRAIGPAIRASWERRAEGEPAGFDAESPEGQGYLRDAAWAARFAELSRARMLDALVELVRDVLGIDADPTTRVEIDHNHVRSEEHEGECWWVHRKGAQGLPLGASGLIPGSMGSASFHVEGRGHAASLCSASHGAGRVMSRADARRKISARRLEREVTGVWFDHRLRQQLREEAPSSYKDISAVMRAQRDLVKITRRLEPVLVYKGT
ncbi:RtcB family protein [Myxococcota bacterium]|nr:RtcB family protein [Myxococcota bacterium]